MVAVSMGERGQRRERTVDIPTPTTSVGTTVRLNMDGSVPDDNPFVGQEGARPEVYSYGHRNQQGMAIHPETGAIWEAEFGEQDGDEINVLERGGNYGWPVVSWGIHYNGDDIPDPPTRPEFADAVKHWSPVISPSGMDAYTGDVFDAWTGSFFIGSLTRHGLVRIEIEGDAVAHEEIIPLGARIREVEAGPDGLLYVLTDQDDGNVWRLSPLQ